ncbi:hypothetical protein OF83DRAFT_1179644 [Amylostereum chailletii]|nr:hypothetical protein OF83DRAFT_1179644 [Amylostereum chailletii]
MSEHLQANLRAFLAPLPPSRAAAVAACRPYRVFTVLQSSMAFTLAEYALAPMMDELRIACNFTPKSTFFQWFHKTIVQPASAGGQVNMGRVAELWRDSPYPGEVPADAPNLGPEIWWPNLGAAPPTRRVGLSGHSPQPRPWPLRPPPRCRPPAHHCRRSRTIAPPATTQPAIAPPAAAQPAAVAPMDVDDEDGTHQPGGKRATLRKEKSCEQQTPAVFQPQAPMRVSPFLTLVRS